MTPIVQRSRTPALLLAAAAIAFVLSGCGEDARSPESPATESRSSAGDTVVTEADPGSGVVRVVYTRTGGLTGETQELVFTSDGPPPAGYTAAQRDQVIAAATDPALAKVTLPVPETCCDKYVYHIVVSVGPELRHTFSTADGEPWPPAFRRLMRAL